LGLTPLCLGNWVLMLLSNIHAGRCARYLLVHIANDHITMAVDED